MSEELAAVMDAPEVDTGASLETDNGASTGAENGAEGAQVGQDAIDNADSPQEGETGHLRGVELFRAVKDKLRNGEKLTLQEFRSLRAAIHIAGKADEVTGGDLGRFESERAAYSQLADEGDEGLTPEEIVGNALDERNFWRDFDTKFESGDRSIVNLMFERNPDSARNLLLGGMGELSQRDNEAFSSYVANAALNYLDKSKIPLQFALLDTFLPEKSNDPGTQRVIDAINAIRAAFQGLEGMAAKPIHAKAAPNGSQNGANGNDREQALSEREMNLTRSEWNQTAARSNIQLRDSEMQKAASARKVTLTDDEKTQIKAGVRNEFEARLGANRGYGTAMQGFLRGGNRRGYEERAASEGRKLLPGIVQRHTNAVLDARKTAAKPNGAAKPAANGSAVRPTAAGSEKDASGNLIQWLAGSPRSFGKQIDYNRTTNGMIQRGEAYLKGEKALFKWKLRQA